jgi:hypothetical protein
MVGESFIWKTKNYLKLREIDEGHLKKKLRHVVDYRD